MRFFAPLFSLLAAVAVAQSECRQNCISIPTSGLQVTAGQRFTITWSNPSAGQITIKLQPSLTNITPTSGYTLATNVDASAGSYSVLIPTDLVNSNQYTFETVDQSNPSNINFSTSFAIAGATGVSTMVTSTVSSASSSSASSRSSASSSSSASSASSASSSSSASSASASSSSASRTSASATATTAAPNSNTNAASSLKVEGALIALVAAGVAFF